MNLRVLEASRHRPSAGDVFVMHPAGMDYLFGRVVSTDANPLGVGGGILIYVYRATSANKTDVPVLDRDGLVIPPLITNALPWRRGYFEHVCFRPLTATDVLPEHRFRDPLTGAFRDERGNVAPATPLPCGVWGLHSFRTIDDELSTALGLPLSADD